MSSNRSSKHQQSSSAVSQINKLKPIPGLDDNNNDDDVEDITQRPISGRDPQQSGRQSQHSVMKDVEPISTRQSPKSVISSPIRAGGNNDQSIMSSVMGDSSMGSVMQPIDFSRKQHPQQENSDTDTVFVKTNAVSRPAIVKEQNNWIKKQNVDMTRSLPLGSQPGDADVKKVKSHTGVPSRINSKTAVSVSVAPASSPAPLLKKESNESSDPPSAEKFQKNLRKKPSLEVATTTREKQTAKEKKVPHVRKRSTAPAIASKSAPNSPMPSSVVASASISTKVAAPVKDSSTKESAFMKFAKNLLPSPSQSSGGPGGVQKSKSTTTVHERRKTKPSEKRK